MRFSLLIKNCKKQQNITKYQPYTFLTGYNLAPISTKTETQPWCRLLFLSKLW